MTPIENIILIVLMSVSAHYMWKAGFMSYRLSGVHAAAFGLLAGIDASLIVMLNK